MSEKWEAEKWEAEKWEAEKWEAGKWEAEEWWKLEKSLNIFDTLNTIGKYKISFVVVSSKIFNETLVIDAKTLQWQVTISHFDPP